MSLHSDARAVAGTHRPSDAEGPIAPSGAPRSWRLFVAFGVAMLFLARVTIQLADVQLLDRSGYAARASSEVNQSLPIVASRGTIVDRFGNILAVDVERRSLYVVPAQIDPGEAAKLRTGAEAALGKLGGALAKTVAALKPFLTNTGA